MLISDVCALVSVGAGMGLEGLAVVGAGRKHEPKHENPDTFGLPGYSSMLPLTAGSGPAEGDTGTGRPYGLEHSDWLATEWCVYLRRCCVCGT